MDITKEKNVSGQTSKELEEYWDKFAAFYTKMIESNTSQALLSLLNMCKITEAESTLETACGSSYLLPLILKMKRKSARYTLCDISEKMLEYSKMRLESLIPMDNGSCPEFSKALSEKNIAISKEDNEALSFADSSFDVYVSNLSLHSVNNPHNMLNEAYRVLNPGRRIGVSVWGRPENSKVLSLFPDVLRKNNIKLPETSGRSLFHLHKREELMQLIERNGFKNILCWYQFSPYNYLTREDMAKLSESPTFGNVLGTEELKEKVIDDCYELLNKEFNETRQPIGLEILLAIGEKSV